jgi:hypothetical protein
MAGFEALCFCDTRNVGMGRLCAVARTAKDLQVLRCICATHSEGQYVVNVPSFAGVDLLIAYSTEPLPHEEQI